MTGRDPYSGKTDAQVLEIARQALLREASLRPGSVERGIQGCAFDSAMTELNRRAIAHVLAKIRQQDEG